MEKTTTLLLLSRIRDAGFEPPGKLLVLKY
jgi:hypothetical protein